MHQGAGTAGGIAGVLPRGSEVEDALTVSMDTKRQMVPVGASWL
jgi:hypothetical protein